VGFWDMAGNAKDRTPYSNNGTVTSGTLTTDRKGQSNSAYSFTGSTGSNIFITNTFGLGNTNATISCWVNLASTSLRGAFVKIGDNQVGTNNGFGIGVGSNTMDVSGNELLGVYEGIRWIDTNQAIGTGWHHVAITIDGSSLPRMYLDGALLNSYAGTAPAAPTTSKTWIGGYTSSTSVNRHVNGVVDDVKVYNRQLSDAEVMLLYGSYN
jgi:hypothetical protein